MTPPLIKESAQKGSLDACPSPSSAQPVSEHPATPPQDEVKHNIHHRHRHRKIVHQDEAPDHARYEFITHGYRVGESPWTAALGLFKLHNETINVWTHMLGFLWFSVELPWILERVHSQGGGTLDAVCFLLFIGCAQFQMLASTIYHLLRCVSRDWDDFLLRIDIVGIVVMVMGSFIVSLNTGFRCRPELAAMYLIIEAVPLLVASGLLLQSSLQSLFMVRVRNSLLVGAVAFGVIPVAHVLVECRFECSDHVIPAALGMFGPYFIGFVFFALRIPERWMPGWFNLVLSSHQIWHFFVWLAGAAWLRGMVSFHAWAVQNLECSSI